MEYIVEEVEERMLERDLRWVYDSEKWEKKPPEEDFEEDDDHEWLKEGFVKG